MAQEDGTPRAPSTMIIKVLSVNSQCAGARARLCGKARILRSEQVQYLSGPRVWPGSGGPHREMPLQPSPTHPLGCPTALSHGPVLTPLHTYSFPPTPTPAPCSQVHRGQKESSHNITTTVFAPPSPASRSELHKWLNRKQRKTPTHTT